VSLEFAEYGRRGVARELGSAIGFEGVDRLDQAEAGDLQQVLERLVGIRVAKREVPRQREEAPDELLAGREIVLGDSRSLRSPRPARAPSPTVGEEIGTKLVPRARTEISGRTKKLSFSGAFFKVSDGTRTRDRLDHNQELYRLSYAHRDAPAGQKGPGDVRNLAPGSRLAGGVRGGGRAGGSLAPPGR
jgi:hypothetical protein